jgi:Transmembrane amino acid transporter protein
MKLEITMNLVANCTRVVLTRKRPSLTKKTLKITSLPNKSVLSHRMSTSSSRSQSSLDKIQSENISSPLIGKSTFSSDLPSVPIAPDRISIGTLSDSSVLKRRRPKRSILTSTIDLCNTIVGTGVVSLPYAFSTIGLGMGTVFVVISVWATWFTLRLMISAAQTVHGSPNAKFSTSLQSMDGEPSFSSLGQVMFSTYGSVLNDFVVFLACGGFAMSYIVSIGECMPEIVKAFLPPDHYLFSILENRHFWMTVFLIVIIPLVFSKSVDDFSWFAAACIVCALFLAFTIIYNSFMTDTIHDKLPTISWVIILDRKTFDCIPIFIFAFTAHQNIFSIYKEIDANYISGEALDYGMDFVKPRYHKPYP